jgi:hypothetical protein
MMNRHRSVLKFVLFIGVFIGIEDFALDGKA